MTKKSRNQSRKTGNLRGKASKLATILLGATALNCATPIRLMNHPLPQEPQLPYGIPKAIWYDSTFGGGLQEVPRDYCNGDNSDIVDKEFLSHIRQIESAGNPRAVSKKRARGEMQIMPVTFKEESEKIYGRPLPFEMAFDPVINFKVGTYYLRETIPCYLSQNISGWEEMSKKDQQNLIAAAYNGGMTLLVEKLGKVEDMYRETREYVIKLEKKRQESQRQYASVLE